MGEMEKSVLNVLKFKLTPDTLLFWLDLGIRLWDLYVEEGASNFGCQLYKPQEVHKDYNRYEPLR